MVIFGNYLQYFTYIATKSIGQMRLFGLSQCLTLKPKHSSHFGSLF